jgi:TatD DNase family protein
MTVPKSRQYTAFLPWAIDTHCHLDHPDYDEDLDAVWKAAQRCGVHYAIIPATDSASFARAEDIIRHHHGIWAASGLHPHEASHASEELPRIRQALEQGSAIAVGETGLDYHYKHSTTEEQQASFRSQIEMSREFNLPLIIHVREAWEDARNLLDQYDLSSTKLIFHAFSGDEDDARWVLEHGGYLGIGGVLTFTRTERLTTIVRNYPRDRILLETDAPYLTPEPHRGRRNLPAYVGLVAERLASLWGIPVAEVRAQTSLTARQVFGLPRAGQGQAVYRLKDNLYINMTNRCPNRCAFCLCCGLSGIGGAELWLDLEPTVDEVVAEFDERSKSFKPAEIVFCGFGEPTTRWDDVYSVGKQLRQRGLKLRLDSNGLGNLLAGRDITSEVAEVMDAVSISLNAPDAGTYQSLCHPRMNNAFTAVVDFIKACVQHGLATTVTVVDRVIDSQAVTATEELAHSLEATFRVRSWV